jgi:hypothetical protein
MTPRSFRVFLFSWTIAVFFSGVVAGIFVVKIVGP